jgi:hypothetical protein
MVVSVRIEPAQLCCAEQNLCGLQIYNEYFEEKW